MNAFISKIFGFALTIMHFLVVIGCILIAFGISEMTENYIEASGVVAALVILFVYAIVIGFITTIVSINEKLSTLIEIVEKK
tara:strand:+ start:597 stop:842 length:246 start_codon:yes stop_codon:yes gene_type:complete